MGSSSSEEDQSRVACAEDPAWLGVMRYSSLLALPIALDAALKLGVFEALAAAHKDGHGALSAQEIVTLLPANVTNPHAAAMLDRVLCLLSTDTASPSPALLKATTVDHDDHKNLMLIKKGKEDHHDGADEKKSTMVMSEHDAKGQESPDTKGKVRKYSLIPAAKYLLRDASGISVGQWFMTATISRLPALTLLDKVIAEGGSGSERFLGKKVSEHVAQHAHELAHVMASLTTIFMSQFLEVYQGFKDFDKDGACLVDVGGCTGDSLKHILDKYPHIHGINYDQPHVVASAPPHPRIQHIGGNMLEDVPLGDAIFMKLVLHDWEDDDCIKILRNCHKSLKSEHGKVIAAERPVMDALRDHALAHQFDLLMMSSHGSKARSVDDYKRLGIASGFEKVQVACLINEFVVFEFLK